MEESFRQALSAVYFALAEAAGGDGVLRHANTILEDAVYAGAVRDRYACAALMSLVRNTDPPPSRKRRRRRAFDEVDA
jgi:hypothetical protein